MKRIINGVTYNTDTASVVARYNWIDDDRLKVASTVYQTRGGAFFIVHSTEGELERPVVEPTDRDGLQRTMEWSPDFEIVDGCVLEDPPEAAVEVVPEATIYGRVPAGLKRRFDEKARAEGQTGNAFLIRCLERCIGSAG